jgi:putative ABC transport system ATP-binding protein
MITHEPDIAEHAKRIIFIRDGKIVNDSVNKNRKTAASIKKEVEKHD